MRLLFNRRAEVDIEDIGDYIAKDNPRRAVSFVEEILQHCREMVDFPEAAPLRPEYGVGVRVRVFKRYLVFYVIQDGVLQIRRVVHGARDLTDLD